MYRVGFIGTGNMGSALAKAAAKVKSIECFYLANRSREKANALKDKILEINPEAKVFVCDNKEVAINADYIFLGVKPKQLKTVVFGIDDALVARKDRPVLVSMAASTEIEAIDRWTKGEDLPIIRIMPNTPAEVGEGMTLYSCSNIIDEEIEGFLEIMSESGRLSPIDESLIDAGSAVSGCGPAWAYMFAEALADGGVACGLARGAANEYAAQMLLGAAKMLLESGEHPGKLKDNVCSPGGTTIQGVRKLEEAGFRSAVFEAVVAAYEKTKE